MDKSRRDELTNSLLYLSNLSRPPGADPLSPGKTRSRLTDTQKLLNDSLRLLQLSTPQMPSNEEAKDPVKDEEPTSMKEESSLMSAFGHGHVMLTSSNKNFQSKERKEDDGYWTNPAQFEEFKEMLETQEERAVFYSNDPIKVTEEHSILPEKKSKRMNSEIKEVSANKEESEASVNSLSPEKQIILSTCNSKPELDIPNIQSEPSQLIFQTVETKKSGVENKDVGVIEYTGEPHANSVISETTMEMKNSAMINASKLIKQANSKSFFEPILESEKEDVNKSNLIKLVSTREGPRSSKKKSKNHLYDPEPEEEKNRIQEDLEDQLDMIRMEMEEKKIITENIANNTNSSINLNEEIKKVSESLKNFESFSQKTGGMDQTMESQSQEFRFDGAFNKTSLAEEDFIDSLSNAQLTQSMSKRKTSRSSEEAGDLPMNEKLQRLIQKDLGKEINVESDVQINLIQSSTGGHPKHNIKTQRESPLKEGVAKQSQELLKKIRDRTRETKNSLLDFSRSKSSKKNSKKVLRDSSPGPMNLTHFDEVNLQFSKTLNYSKEDEDEPIKYSKQKNTKGTRRKIKPKGTRASQTLNDLLRIKRSEDSGFARKINRSIQIFELGNFDVLKARNIQSMKSSNNFMKSPSKSTKNISIGSHRISHRGFFNEGSPKTEAKKSKLLNLRKSIKTSMKGSKASMSNYSPSIYTDEVKFTKKTNFTKKKVDSGVFDRLSRPKGSLVMQKSSHLKLASGQEDQIMSESISGEDLILSSLKTNEPEKGEMMFDSSLLKLENVTQSSCNFEHEKLTDSSEEKKEEETKQAPLIFKKKKKTEVFVEEGMEIEKEVEHVNIQNEEIEKKAKHRRIKRKALTPHNSLKKEYKHLKPSRREKFIITDADFKKFLKRAERREKHREERKQSQIKKQFKNFFEHSEEKSDENEPKLSNQTSTSSENNQMPQTSKKNEDSEDQIAQENQELAIEAPKNIFKETKDQTVSEQEQQLLDYQFSDQYSRYKQNPEQYSERALDQASDLTSAVDYTSHAPSDNYFGEPQSDNLGSLYNFQQRPLFRNTHQVNTPSHRTSHKFKSETKSMQRGNLRQKKRSVHESYKRSYGNKIKHMSSKYKSEKGAILFKNQSHSILKTGPGLKARISPSLYEGDSIAAPRLTSPSNRSSDESQWSRAPRRKNSKVKRRRVESTYVSDAKNIYYPFDNERHVHFTGSHVSGSQEFQRPIININLGNQPVENLKIVSVPNHKRQPKDGMMIQVSYTPSGSQANSKLDNLLSLENSRANHFKKKFHVGKGRGNMVKSILSKRKQKKDSKKEFVISGDGRHRIKTYGQDPFLYGPHGQYPDDPHARKQGAQLSNKDARNSPEMMDSNCLDHFHIEQMVQNEDDEILQVMQNQEQIYKITFADSQQSADLQDLLQSTADQINYPVRRSPREDAYLYNQQVSPERSPFRRGSNMRKGSSISPNQRKFKYVYEGQASGDEWAQRFGRYKMETMEQEFDTENFEADVSQEEQMESPTPDSPSFENSFDESD